MKKLLFLTLTTLCLSGCGSTDSVQKDRSEAPPPAEDLNNPDNIEGLELVCSSSGSGDSLVCTNGSDLPFPPAFPYSKDCNQCKTTVTGGIATVNCPNGLVFEFVLQKGDKGDKGDKGADGKDGKDGKDGSSCSVGADGWVRCTDGTAYKLLQGPKGDKGDKGDTGAAGPKGNTGATGATGATGPKGDTGQGCTTYKNTKGETVIKCGLDEEVISCGGCGCGGCWSFGAKGNVYTVPTTTTVLPNLTAMTPEESVTVPRFDMFNRSWTLGYPGLPTRTEWFAIRYTGYILLDGAVSNVYKLRLTSDDGAKLYIDGTVIVNADGLHPPLQVVGAISALPGWHSLKVDWFQGPRNQMALALEISTDNGVTWTVVPEEKLKFQIQ